MKLFTGSTPFTDQVDSLVLGMTVVCGLVALIIVCLIVYYCFKYHASKQKDKRLPHSPINKLEYFLITATLTIFLIFFFWASNVYRLQMTPPKKVDYRVYVFAKRWMWKFQHENGFMEVNELHLPRNKKIHLIMISQDVIHSFFVPSFRVKQDVLPELYTSLFLEPIKSGTENLFCAEYCGTGHSRMTGEILVMDEKKYLEFILIKPNESMADQGKKLFKNYRCLQCHEKGPPLAPVLGSIGDENKLRKAIFYPHLEIKKEYSGAMPSYKDQIAEEDLAKLIEYIKHLDQSHG